ncbi:Ig-like domain-containing protein [Hyalangium sp.]|uniref:Ig-like domain-containing protein n=1 Tax=Hyalangium sp. TaxID=2028555 RepID=UPI002D440A8F|nr:Ig-like domain-containing protein [Hyalangium sp.]HYI00125.1 Ig-like domain-containing protein [Hyalangium sp.]
MRRVSIFVLCTAFLALTLSTGCGGGGEEGPPDSGTPYVPPVPDAGPPDAGPKPDAGPLDLAPPVVLSHSPEANATGVPPESFIEVNFSEAMQTSRGTLQIIPGDGLPNNGLLVARPEYWDVTRRTVRFSFPLGLPLRAFLTVNLANFADVAGNVTQGFRTFAFTVSDGVAPSVSSTSPSEGASSVPLSTSEIVINFNQPMDTSVGTLVPGGGLSLGTPSWTGNQALRAPITSTLVNNGLYSVRLENFRNINVKAMDGAPYLGDGKLDFGTGPDTIAPTVREASPVEGATNQQYESTRFVVFTFSEPMDTNLGMAELVDGSTRTPLATSFSGDGFTVTCDAQFKLRPGATLRVELTGFKDRAGNALVTTPFLGSNGALDFTMAPDTVKPYVTQTNVPEGATDVYPVEVFSSAGNPGYRKVFTFRFSEPMDPSVTLVTLHDAQLPSSFRNLAGVWSPDRLTMTLTISPPSSGLPPIEADKLQYLELNRLKDATGNLLDTTIPPLGDGRLNFRTLLNQRELNHACEHAETQGPLLVTATSSVTAGTPRSDVLHGLYELTLPGSGNTFSGYTRAQLITNQTQPIFMNGAPELTVTDPASPQTGIGVTLLPVPPACPSITHEARFGTVASPLNLRFSHGQQRLRIVLEDTY